MKRLNTLEAALEASGYGLEQDENGFHVPLKNELERWNEEGDENQSYYSNMEQECAHIHALVYSIFSHHELEAKFEHEYNSLDYKIDLVNLFSDYQISSVNVDTIYFVSQVYKDYAKNVMG